MNKFLIISLSILIANSWINADPMIKYYLPTDFNGSEFSKHIDISLGISTTNTDRLTDIHGGDVQIQIRKMIFDEFAKFPGSISLIGFPGNRRLGLFFNKEIHGKFPPYFQVFGNSSSMINGSLRKRADVLADNLVVIGDYRATVFTKARLSVLDFNDASLDLIDMDTVNKIESLEVLAMPRRGMRYDKPFSFPKGLKTLVIRNAELTTHLVRAMEDNKTIEELAIVGCFARKDYNWPPTSELYRLQDPTISPTKQSNPLSGIVTNLKTLEIIDSDPTIFENFNVLKWPKLEKLRVDIFTESDFFKRNLAKNTKDFREMFPSLKHVEVFIFDASLSSDLITAIQTNQTSGLVFEIKHMK